MSVRLGFIVWIWMAGLMFFHWPALAADKPEVLSRSVYKGSISGWKVEMVRTLTQNGDGNYSLRSEAKNMFASIMENSDFTVKNRSLLPLDYVYDRRVFGRQTREQIVFDWGAQSAFYTRSDRAQNNTRHPLHQPVLDPALYQLALQADLANHVSDLNYEFIKRKRLETYQFERLAGEAFQLHKKTYKTLILMREDKEKKKTTKVWVLPELDYLVGKIQHTDDGDTYQVTLASYQGNPAGLRAFYASLLRSGSQ